jgi:DHA1 family bicyclomycin/chloramphenicol resistance-like MFS transporter
MAENRHLKLILILGSLTALSPFSIDMYLSAFPLMAKFFKTDVAGVSVTLSSYFVGLASGQLFYGPLMDRFGRKKPLAIGLIIYILASLACAFTDTLQGLVIFRFIQAVGGCAASVAAFAMVRDLFDPRESAKVISLLILILGASPLLAPTIGGYLALAFGWTSVFIVLTLGATLLLIVILKFLPESHGGDKAHVLRFIPIAKTYFSILKEPSFYTYALAGAIGFSGLFVYLAASPTIFMEIFKVSEEVYGWIFAIIAMGLVGMSQFNVKLLRTYSNEQILRGALIMLVGISLIFYVCAFFGWFNLYSVVTTMFFLLACVGLSNPNSTSLAMAPFGSKAGSASAMIGFLQMGVGALASLFVGILEAQKLSNLAGIFVTTSGLALIIFLIGSRRIIKSV